LAVEQVPEFAKFVQQRLRRTEWRDFPDVIIHAEESLVKKHPPYAPAKGGDVKAAEGLVLEASTIGALDKISSLIGDKRPHLLAVHALETEGANAIPRTFARLL
jgi:hypothetical protein